MKYKSSRGEKKTVREEKPLDRRKSAPPLSKKNIFSSFRGAAWCFDGIFGKNVDIKSQLAARKSIDSSGKLFGC
jgi:hypothetical protein